MVPSQQPCLRFEGGGPSCFGDRPAGDRVSRDRYVGMYARSQVISYACRRRAQFVEVKVVWLLEALQARIPTYVHGNLHTCLGLVQFQPQPGDSGPDRLQLVDFEVH